MAFLFSTLGIVLAGVAMYAGWRMVTDLRVLRRRVQIAERRITELATAQARRLPFVTADEIENSLAALWRVRDELDLKAEFVENAIMHMQKARIGYKAKK